MNRKQARGEAIRVWQAIVVKTATNLIEFNGWTQGARARDHDGDPIEPSTYEAETYSIVGALQMAMWVHEPSISTTVTRWKASQVREELLNLFKERAADNLQEWNDEPGRSAAHVVDLLVQVADVFDPWREEKGGHCDSLNVVTPVAPPTYPPASKPPPLPPVAPCCDKLG